MTTRFLPPMMIMTKSTSLLALLFVAVLIPAAHAIVPRYDGVLNPALLATQDEINSGTVSLQTLFYRGMHFYSNRFTTNDGLGEAPDGPRRRVQLLAQNTRNPFLRFNGLDAQACLECHSALGFKRYGDLSMAREPGTVGAGAGISASVMIFENPNDLDHGIVRNPPHTFGLGYIQRLSDEMTAELLAERDAALAEAEATGENVHLELEAKGVHFGSIVVLPNRAMDRAGIEGLSIDMVVRPFQFKGVASSLRNFIAGALNFHFSVQPKELMDRAFIPDDNPNKTLPNDKHDEVMEGEVTTIATFLAAMRPPQQDATDLDVAAVNRGRALMDSTGCTSCHIPSLRIDDPLVTIADPRFLRDFEYYEEGAKKADFISIRRAKVNNAPPAMTAAEEFSDYLAPVVQYEWKKNPSRFAPVAKSGKRPLPAHPPGFTFNLNDPNLPDEARPRLPHNPDGSIDVPLFSDLRRHKMGDYLADTVPQRTEMQSILAPADEFVTRPLWGVNDTAPWLHDGRATTLREAIIMHDGPGSEAASSVALFNQLSQEDQDSIIEFLCSLRLPGMGHAPEPGVLHREAFVTQ